MKDNILFICLDSCRYDTFKKAETPNTDKIGRTKKAYSYASWTIPSIIGYMMGYPPMDNGGGSLFPPHDVQSMKFAPQYYRDELGYKTIWASSNAFITQYDKMTNCSLSNNFNYFLSYLRRPLKKTHEIMKDLAELVKETEKPVFMMTLLMCTHKPYHDEENIWKPDLHNINSNFNNQVKSIEYADRSIKPLIQSFKDKDNDTQVTITSDHGEQWGPYVVGHNPSNRVCFDTKLFEIPYIRGKISGK